MKKNKMMRMASMLLILVLLTTCTISGTFAKYVTSDSAEDSARVAKWGVTALVSGSLFGQHYNSFSESSDGNEIATRSNNVANSSGDDENLVAPGTQNTKGLYLSISGTPEVANEIVVSNEGGNYEEIFLAKGTYATLVKNDKITDDNFADNGPLYTVSETGKTFAVANAYKAGVVYYEVHDICELDADYYPVTYTWTTEEGTAKVYTDVNDLYSEISSYFNSVNNANVEIDKYGVITWKWAFDGNDKADTILGNLMAEATDQIVVRYDSDERTATALTDGTDYNLTTNFDVTITITQVD